MSSYEDQCVKVRVVFHVLYFENEVSDSPIFCISDIGNSLSDCRQTMTKICAVGSFLRVRPQFPTHRFFLFCHH